MTRIQFIHAYQHIISLENLLEAWKEFLRGKKSRKDVQEFERDLMTNIISLHNELVLKTYKHSPYEAFNISDPKPRNIHKAKVRDRLLHHAIYRMLYPFFDRTFIYQSYSCRYRKGTQKAIQRLQGYMYKATNNHTKTAWVLKCDIRKFFASIDHETLIKIIKEYIPDQDIVWLMKEIISSFPETGGGVGLPLGNLTSQLLVNIYMNKFDHFVKHSLKAKYYVRYADDFIIVSEDKEWLLMTLREISNFLWNSLKLKLHPHKISIRTIASGNDFLGWVHFSDHCILRTVTKRRMFKNIGLKHGSKETVQSYLGLLKYGNTGILKDKVKDMVSLLP
jgi:retron-type reverse transcriptase